MRHAHVGNERLPSVSGERHVLDREHVLVHARRRQLAGTRHRRDAGQGLEPRLELLEEPRPGLGRRELAHRQLHHAGEHPRRIVSHRRARDREQAAHEEPRTRQQAHRERELSRHERPTGKPNPSPLRPAAPFVAQRRLHVASGGEECGHQPEDGACRQRHDAGDQHDGPVDREIGIRRQCGQRETAKCRERERGEEKPDAAARHCEDRALREQLPHHPSPARAERHADGELLPS